MLIDFHTHSSASDGALSPLDLLQRARDREVSLLAITDHDTVAGYCTAAAHYTQNFDDVRLIPGVELSCVWSGVTVHVVGLGMDCSHPAMIEALTTLDAARVARAEKIGQRLGKLGFAGALEGAQAEAGESQLGRPHFAAWMVNEGHVADHNEAFDRYLGQGKPGDVKAFWPSLERVVQWIQAAGGVPVLAHPLKYRLTRMKLRRLVVDFMEAGGLAVETISGRQSQDQVAQLQRLAREFELEVSIGSDFHRDGPYSPLLGVELPRSDGLRGVWERWRSPAAVTD